MEYRLSWEMLVPAPTGGWDTVWTETSRVFGDEPDSDGFDQYETLKRWAESGEEPVRNVKLEWRPVAEWEEVPA
jgi:hypothetical protein